MYSRFSLKSFFFVLLGTGLSLSSCNNKILEEIGARAVTGDALNVGFESVVLTGSASVSGSSTGDITIGVHYSLSEGMLPTNFDEEEAESFDKNYAFSIEIEGLDPETKYYYRTFVKERDVYTFGQTKSFTTAKAPGIKLSSESASLNFMEQTGSFNVTITNPASGYTLIASSNDDWITDVVLNGNTVSYKVSGNGGDAERSGNIILSYGSLEKIFKITQTSTSLSISPSSADTDYTSKTLSFTYSIVNPVDGISMTAISEEQWITDIKVSDATVSYKVAENNSGSLRAGKIKLSYGGAIKEFSVTQTYTASVITCDPSSQSTDYTAKSLSFTATVSNLREGCSLAASTTDSWITNVQLSGTTVSYKVAENNSGAQRIGKIKLTYAAVTAEFSVTQNRSRSTNGHEYVDLGLSVVWATCNVGATKPEDYGGYYQWAGIKDVTDKSIYLDLSNCPYHTGSDYKTSWTKYVPSDKSSYWSGTGSPDNKTVLDPSDDVASVTWKGSWRMPTDAEWTELRNTSNCSWTWTSINGINGYKVQSKKSGYTDNWIFLPAAGCRCSGSLIGVGFRGYYWSSSLNTDGPSSVYGVYFYSVYVYRYLEARYDGESVRPVSE